MAKQKAGLHAVMASLGFLVLGIIPTPVRPDDSVVDVAGGSARLLQEHPAISMSDEFVRIDMLPGSYKVKAIFHFYNSGPSTTVAVGFPVEGETSDPLSPAGKREFLSFRTSVNGKRVKTEDFPNPDFGHTASDSFSGFKVKRVSFAEKSTTTSVVQYEAPHGGSSNGEIWFRYFYGTGRSWHGPIGRAVFDFRFDEDLVGLDISFKNSASILNRSRGQLVYEMTSVEPDADAVVTVGFREIGPCIGDEPGNAMLETICSFMARSEPGNPTLMSLGLRRNAIYAKHGRMFKDASLGKFFAHTGWYSPRPDYADTELDDAERQSVAALKGEEDEIVKARKFVFPY